MTTPTAVFLAHTAAPSGAELATLRLVSAMPETRTAIVYAADGPMLRLAAERGIQTRVVRSDFDSRAMTIDKAGVRSLVAGGLGLLRLGWRIGATLRELDATVLVAGSTKAMLMGAVAARRARIPLVWHVHDRISGDYFGRTLALIIRLLGWTLARGVIANSRGTLASLYTWRRAALVAYPGVEFPAEGDGTERDQRPARETVIAVVGRLAPWKGQDLFLRALADVKIQPREVFLVGGTFFDEEHYRAELETLATALGLPVTFTGHVDDPEAYLRHADILVHCSVLPEPFGQVVVEGMRAGCAVVATRPGGPEEIVEPGVNGLLVPAGDRAALTSALDTLIADQELRAKLADAARVRARDFDVAESGRQVTAFLGDPRVAGAPLGMSSYFSGMSSYFSGRLRRRWPRG
ncbi:glycosyltransferase family 1 protein [Nocardia yunnanensis]|uniref:Glycosyltransferase family 1 protein n=1 Tax=Nocardia yunnanensis TaxID=2382165 RepID=A0A386ZB78_9NOCA|nr:glycosyltransferase family 4 protein [Nocardia yunnanensis]AYF73749.1 glycosyltransferase family 1 protein [Nocardia yunnanensis]